LGKSRKTSETGNPRQDQDIGSPDLEEHHQHRVTVHDGHPGEGNAVNLGALQKFHRHDEKDT
jgi:hypothetical protein